MLFAYKEPSLAHLVFCDSAAEPPMRGRLLVGFAPSAGRTKTVQVGHGAKRCARRRHDHYQRAMLPNVFHTFFLAGFRVKVTPGTQIEVAAALKTALRANLRGTGLASAQFHDIQAARKSFESDCGTHLGRRLC